MLRFLRVATQLYPLFRVALSHSRLLLLWLLLSGATSGRSGR